MTTDSASSASHRIDRILPCEALAAAGAYAALRLTFSRVVEGSRRLVELGWWSRPGKDPRDRRRRGHDYRRMMRGLMDARIWVAHRQRKGEVLRIQASNLQGWELNLLISVGWKGPTVPPGWLKLRQEIRHRSF